MQTTVPPPLLTFVSPAHWLRLDYFVAAVSAVAASLLLVNLASGAAGALAVIVGTIASAAPMALRRRRPVLSVCVLLAALMLAGVFEPKALVLGLLPLAYVLYVTAAVTRPRTALLALAASLCAALGTALPDLRHLGAATLFCLLYMVVWTLGYAVGMHRRYTFDLLDYQARLAAVELQASRQKVTQERVRIARELHDVVAHGMSVITVQAGYGQLVLREEPEAAQAALSAIEITGRQTLTEMRSLLTVLRQDRPGDVPDGLALTPTPGLADLDKLVEQTGKAGVQVALKITGTVRPLPPGIDLSAYRIVQEALTNVVKHAGTPLATVRVGFQDEELTLDVTDQGIGCLNLPLPGHGLVGIRERVHLYGGSVQAHAGDSGRGFQVSCRIPLTRHVGEAALSQPAATPA